MSNDNKFLNATNVSILLSQRYRKTAGLSVKMNGDFITYVENERGMLIWWEKHWMQRTLRIFCSSRHQVKPSPYAGGEKSLLYSSRNSKPLQRFSYINKYVMTLSAFIFSTRSQEIKFAGEIILKICYKVRFLRAPTLWVKIYPSFQRGSQG